MYYDTKSELVDDEDETEIEHDDSDDSVTKKNRKKESKQFSNKKSKKSKEKTSNKSKKNINSSKSSKSGTVKKSRAIIEDDDDDDDDDEITAASLAGPSVLKSNLDDDDDDDEDEEDDDEEAAKEEFNDFIDDDVDEDEDEDKDSEKSSSTEESSHKHHKKEEKKSKKKKKDKKLKRKRKDKTGSGGSGSSADSSSSDNLSELEEDDLDLIKNNLNVDDLEEVGIAAKKRRRIKIASESSEDEQNNEANREKSHKDKKKLKSQRQQSPKKGRDEENDEEGDESKRSSGGGRNMDYEPESDEESFIVDDSEDEAENKNGSDEDDQRIRRSEKEQGQVKKKRLFNDEAQQEALDIFGVNAEELGAISDDSEDDEEYDEDEIEEEIEEEDDEDLEKEIEEDDDLTQKAAKKRQRQRRRQVLHKMEDIFEPQELEKNLMTEFDQQIRIEDKPERFMLRTLPVTSEPNDFELEKEADWIFNQAFQSKKTVSNQEISEPKPFTAVQKIKDVLNFIRNDFLEVPFIAQYRKEYVQPELNVSDLWKIYEMDELYCQLKLRKENLLKLFERMKKYQTEEQLPTLNKKRYKRVLLNDDDDEATEVEDHAIINQIESLRLLKDSDLDRVNFVATIEEFLDCYHHFHLHYSSDLIAMKEFELKETIKASKLRNAAEQPDDMVDPLADIDLDIDILDGAKYMKYASRKDRLFHCKQMGLDSFTKKFGLSCEQYGENLMADYQKHEIEQCEIDPAQIALGYVKEPYFQTVEQVLNTVRYMMSIQLARDPTVRQYVRELYMQNACITVRPTMPRGFKEIDESHNCFRFKYLKQKPCVDLKQDEYLKIALAEQDSLITVKFETLPIKQIVVDQNKQLNESDDPKNSSKSNTYTTYSRSIIEKLKNFFHKDEFSYSAEQWNLQRAQVIEDMCLKFLFPDFEKELKSKLLHEAKNFVYVESARKLNSILKQAPLNSLNDLKMDSKSGHLDYNENGLNVISISFTTNEMDETGGNNLASVAVACFVNGAGDLEEFVRIRNFNLKVNTDSNQQHSKKSDFLSKEKEEKIEDLNKLENLIEKSKPDVIIISCENKDALILQDDVKQILRSIKDGSGIKVEIIDNEIAKIFEGTKQSEQEFGSNLPGLVKQSIALARYVQDPLLCFSQLCNQERDILGYKFHPMQQNLISINDGGRQSDDATRLLRHLEIEFINRVNEVGVDLNRCNQCSHTAYCLQFVAGLGPRKAQHIIKVLRHQRSQLMSSLPQEKQIKTYPVATNRLFLVTKCALGRRVFINCAGFIKFDVDSITKDIDEDDESTIPDESKYTEILDSTRIHPETYNWARKMAVDALEIEDTENDANAASALKEILENQSKLRELDLDAFAAELVRTGHGIKNLTLYDIRKELQFRYKDERSDFSTMSSEEKFYRLINENPQTFYVGKLVLCRCVGIARRRPNKEQLDEANPIKDDNTCMWQCSFCKRNDFSELSQIWSHFDTGECPGPPVGVRAMLDNGCNGFIPLKLLSDSLVTNPEDRIKVGMTVHARITRIDPDRFSVELTCRTSDLRDTNDKWKPSRDEYFDYKAQDEDQFKLDEKKRKEEHRQTYTKRIIAHPQFKNIGYSQAVAYLKDMDVGDAIIRPSSKGNDHLTVTWKINNNCYQHVDVLEEKKQNSFSIGKRLIIEGEDFEDLDEILARYISPMANCVREIMNHKNYKEVEIINAYGSNGELNDFEKSNAANLVAKNDQIELYLLDERAKSPSKIPYLFTCCRNLPGRFLLSYMVKTKLRNESIKISQEGFKFRERSFSSFNELINWFKAHFNDPISVASNPSSSSQEINSTQKISSQMGGMSIINQQQSNSRTPNYPNTSLDRTTIQQPNNYSIAGDLPALSAYSNDYSTNNQETNNSDYNSNNEHDNYRDTGNSNRYYNGDRGARGGSNYRGGGGRGRGGYNSNNWNVNGSQGLDSGTSSNNFNRYNNNYKNNKRFNNNDNWNSQHNYQNSNKSQNFNRSVSQNRYQNNSRSNAEETYDNNERSNRGQTYNNSSRTPQHYNRFNTNNTPIVSNSSNRNTTEENWDDE